MRWQLVEGYELVLGEVLLASHPFPMESLVEERERMTLGMVQTEEEQVVY